MPKFRKKYDVEAIRVEDALTAAKAQAYSLIPDWLRDPWSSGRAYFLDDRIQIETAEGTKVGAPKDWIVSEGPGRIYVRTADAFAAMYEAVEA